MRIAVVGSGTAGPAAAILLARQGHQVTLMERAPRRLPVGAGFLLQPTGWSVLRELGLEDILRAQTTPISKLYCRTRSGQVLLNLEYDELSKGLAGAGTHRATLLNLLLDTAAGLGIELQWNTPILRMSRDTDNRSCLLDESGTMHGPFDLLLVCDGANSTLRAQCGVPSRVDCYPWGALWFIGKRTQDFESHVLWQSVGSTRELIGFLPTGTDDDLLSLFWSIRLDQIEAWRKTPLAVWKRQILELAPQAETFLHQITSHEQVTAAAYHDVRMPCWHAERIAILGDAGHALSPQLGQGVNLALMDASALTKLLHLHPLEEALVLYSKQRRAHLNFYQFATRWMTPFFQSDLLPLGWMRDLAFPCLMHIPWARKQMVATMAGGKTGLFSSIIQS